MCGDRSSVDSYRPICLLDGDSYGVSKVFERLIFDDIYTFVRHKLSDSQLGFREKRSTILQMLKYMDIIYKSFDDSTEIFIENIINKKLVLISSQK